MPPRSLSLLWCVEHDGAIITAQLENLGMNGIAIRLWWNGHPYFTKRYGTRNLALIASEQLRIGFNAGTAAH
jgi:hypothetical protein